MKGLKTNLLAVSLLLLPVSAIGQASSQTPVTNTLPSNDFGFNLPTHLGTLSYALSGSELVGTGYGDGSFSSSTIFSGDLAYLSRSENDPFSVVYSGGYLYSNVPGSNSSSTFQSVAGSQVLRTRSWVYVISDAFSYLPESPTTGLSGIAGAGDIGVYPVQTGLGPSQNILTDYSNRISNGLQGSATWQLTSRLDLQGSADSNILHFLGNSSGLDSDAVDGSVGPSYRIDALNQIGASAYYSRMTYPSFSGYEIESEGLNLTYTKTWSRRLNTAFAFGPEITHGVTLGPIPSRVNLAGTATATYATRTTGIYANYSRGVNAGSGVLYGALSDTAGVGVNRPINRDWVLGLNAGFSRSVNLTGIAGFTPTYKNTFGGIQVSRRISESLSAYGSYTGIEQSFKNGVQASNAFNGFNQTFSVGVTFSPPPLMRGH